MCLTKVLCLCFDCVGVERKIYILFTNHFLNIKREDKGKLWNGNAFDRERKSFILFTNVNTFNILYAIQNNNNMEREREGET